MKTYLEKKLIIFKRVYYITIIFYFQIFLKNTSLMLSIKKHLLALMSQRALAGV